MNIINYSYAQREIIEQEKKLLEELKDNLSKSKILHAKNDHCLLKFLKIYDNKISKTVDKIYDDLEWRKTNKVDEIMVYSFIFSSLIIL